eukprot:8501654-Pyramimonas_sp.AAC.1
MWTTSSVLPGACVGRSASLMISKRSWSGIGASTLSPPPGPAWPLLGQARKSCPRRGRGST